MISKTWYTSKTIWVNAIALVVVIIQAYTGYVVDPVYQGYALAIINLILRFVTTKAIIAPKGTDTTVK
jgi:hypothetical protein